MRAIGQAAMALNDHVSPWHHRFSKLHIEP